MLRGTDAFDSEQLYCLLGLLILEGRIPVQSEHGRKSGPHAHYAFNNTNLKNHVCDPNNASVSVFVISTYWKPAEDIFVA